MANVEEYPDTSPEEWAAVCAARSICMLREKTSRRILLPTPRMETRQGSTEKQREIVIDTIVHKQCYEIDPLYWLDIGFRRVTRDPRVMVYNHSPAPRLTVNVRGRTSHLSAEYSVPKVIHGHNAILPVSLEESLDAVSTTCELTSRIIRKRFNGTEIRRIDYARDYLLGDLAGDEIAHSLCARHIPKMTRRSYENTVYWDRPESGWTCQVCIYEKLPQILAEPHPSCENHQQVLDAATGKIRFEVRMRGTALNRLYKIAGGRSLRHLLDPELSNIMINEFETKLNFLSVIRARKIDFFAAAESARLCSKERGLTRFIYLVQLHGPEFYKNPEFSWPPRTFFHCRRKCVKAGFWDDLVASSAVQIA